MLVKVAKVANWLQKYRCCFAVVDRDWELYTNIGRTTGATTWYINRSLTITLVVVQYTTSAVRAVAMQESTEPILSRLQFSRILLVKSLYVFAGMILQKFSVLLYVKCATTALHLPLYSR